MEREKVECDEDCGAYMEPETTMEFLWAWQHWRSHEADGGCSHGR